MQKLALALIASLFVASAGAAAAQDVRIRISDLDLATPQGADTFDARVQAQARRACAHTGSRLPGGLCVRDFRKMMLAQLPERRRQDYARARTGGPVSARTPATATQN